MSVHKSINAHDALERLRRGNKEYMEQKTCGGDISQERRSETLCQGQCPFAVIIACSDSRVIPEAIFNAGIGDLFVIRVAGNVMDDHQLGSVEYAASHLGAKLIVVLGHDHCGAVDAALNHDPEGYIRFITQEICSAVGDEKDPYRASWLNVKHSIEIIENSLSIHRQEEKGLRVVGAMYRLESGIVEYEMT